MEAAKRHLLVVFLRAPRLCFSLHFFFLRRKKSTELSRGGAHLSLSFSSPLLRTMVLVLAIHTVGAVTAKVR